MRHPFSPADSAGIQPDVVLPQPSKLDSLRRQAFETSRNRLLVMGVLFVLAFTVIGGRLIELSINNDNLVPQPRRVVSTNKNLNVRADITDRNNILLATSLPTAALYANPQHVRDTDEAVSKLVKVLPGLDSKKLRRDLSSDRKFVWLHRKLTPKLQFAVNALGIPGLEFQRAERRVYPHGPLMSHVLGIANIDGRGLSGVEGYFERQLRGRRQPLQLSLDIRIQALVRTELLVAMTEFSAIGAAGIVLDVNTGEIISMVSLPDFNPNEPVTAAGTAGFNRATKGVYEMGSTFKLFTVAMALDTGQVRLRDRYDATKPIKVSRFTISDYHAKNKWMSVPEIIVHSSNIGAAKMALDVGTPNQKLYLKRFGMLSQAEIELLEVGAPLTPDHWRQINTMTIAYGHGIAVSPLQLSMGIGALVNGGILFDATLVKVTKDSKPNGVRVISPKTSRMMRDLMRLVVRQGTGKKAEVAGYFVGGKTGTADKPGVSKRISSFVAAFPMTKPRYVVVALVDEPKGTKATHGYATGGWVAAPVVHEIIRQMVPILGIEPSTKVERQIKPGDALYVALSQKVRTKPTQAVRSVSKLEKRISELLRTTKRPRGRAVAAN